jgi:hypothetical protein
LCPHSRWCIHSELGRRQRSCRETARDRCTGSGKTMADE